MILSAIKTGIDAALGLGSLVFGGLQHHETQSENERLDIARRENLEFQREHLNYEKGIQQEIFNREDSAIQRRVADLQAAGLSPFLAAGSEGAGAGAPVSTEALSNSLDRNENPYQGYQDVLNTAVSLASAVSDLKAKKLANENLAINNRLMTLEVSNRSAYDAALNELTLSKSREEIESLKNSNKLYGLSSEELRAKINSIRANTDLTRANVDNAKADLIQKGLANSSSYLNLQSLRHDLGFYKSVENKLGFRIPYNNYTPLNFAGDALDGLIDNVINVWTRGLLKGAKGLLKGGSR